MRLSRTFILIGTITIVLVIVSGVLNILTARVGVEIEAKHTERFRAFAIADEFRQTSMDLTRLARSYAATGDEGYRDEYWSIVRWRSGDEPRPMTVHSDLYPGETIDQRVIMERVGFTRAEFTMLDDITNMSNELVNLEQQAMETVRLGEIQDGPATAGADEDVQSFAVRILYGETYNNDVQRIWGTVDEFVALLDERIFAEIQELESFRQVLTIASFASQFVIALVVILLVFFMLRTVLAKILGGEPADLASRNWEISRGNLATSISVRSGDAESLAASMKNMVESLQDVVTRVSDAGDRVTNTSAEINDSAQALSQGATEQAASAEEVSSSMEQMGANIRQNSDNAMEAEKISQKAAQNAEEGGGAVTRTVEAMREISDKINIIDEIARNTNLLALNAAIEAARAGEQGKGFAVVASEVRKLAERSQQAAGEIADLSRSSVDVAENAGKTISAIIPDIRRTAELVQEISSASKEQNTGAEQINQALLQLDKVVQQNAGAAEEMASMSEQLHDQAEQLQSVISFFQVDERSETVRQLVAPVHSPSNPAREEFESF